jgi:hypothetical protein
LGINGMIMIRINSEKVLEAAEIGLRFFIADF